MAVTGTTPRTLQLYVKANGARTTIQPSQSRQIQVANLAQIQQYGTPGLTQHAPAPGAFFVDDFSSGNFTKVQNNTRWSNITGGMSIKSGFGYGGSNFCAKFDVNNFAELRFEFGQRYTELWAVVYAWFPSGLESSALGLGPRWQRVISGANFANNKFMRLMGGTSAAERFPRNGMELAAGTPNGDEELNNEVALTSFGGGIGAIPTSYTNGKNFPTDAYRGRWIRMVTHCKKSTTQSSNDGAMDFKMDDEVWIISAPFSQLLDDTGFGNGYFMGSLNYVYPVPQFCFFGRVEFHTSNPG